MERRRSSTKQAAPRPTRTKRDKSRTRRGYRSWVACGRDAQLQRAACEAKSRSGTDTPTERSAALVPGGQGKRSSCKFIHTIARHSG